MPSSAVILDGLARAANGWYILAIGWHGLFGALLLALAGGWRPSRRAAGYMSVLPLLSVAALAWVIGNPFNMAGFATLAVVLAAVAARTSTRPVALAPRPLLVVGVLVAAFGWAYPHFLQTGHWIAYAYAAPLGLIPCPTLAALVGVAIMLDSLGSTPWGLVLAAAGVFYGAVGVFRLGVELDSGLLIGACALVGTLVRGRSVRASRDERTGPLPGDELIVQPLDTLTHAITIQRPPRDVWPWLAQMGAGSRAGWYSYDLLDNGRRQSARRIVPELQHLGVGMVFPAMPGVTDGFTLLSFEPERYLVLGWVPKPAAPLVTWAFELEGVGEGSTRLVVRVRAGGAYRFGRLPLWLTKRVVPVVHFIMQRRQLLNIAARAEARPESPRARRAA
jgi:hypothetical protein